jgi:putative SOS response-associated peptidase YedK
MVAAPEGGEAVESCTIIITEANALVHTFHERMPLILDQEVVDLVLGHKVTEPPSLLPLLMPYPAERMEGYPISDFVNSPSQESNRCVQPIPGPALSSNRQS